MRSPIYINWMLLTEIVVILCISSAALEQNVGNLPHEDGDNVTEHGQYPQRTALVMRSNSEITVYDLSSNSCVRVLFPSPDCIPFTVCDGTNPCHHGNCSVINENDFICDCFDGYQNNGTGTPCEVIDVCESKHCQQNCNSTAIGSECSCVEGFILEENGVSCQFDSSSSFVQCSKGCGNGICLNDTCRCFTGYYHDENGICSLIDACSITPRICGENAICRGTAGGYTCECMPNFRNLSGTCQAINPCNDVSKRQNCESFGKRCRLTSPGDYQCYCALPYFSVKDSMHDACIPPSMPFFMYNLTLDLVRYIDDTYTFSQQLEDTFYNEFFPSITNVTVLNLEVNTANPESVHNVIHLNIYVYFAEQVPYLESLINLLCEPFPDESFPDACILPGMIVIRNSTVYYADLEDVCTLDNSMPEFLCGPLANCQANRTEYECTCTDGYEIGGYINPIKPMCVDIDECTLKNDICGGPTEMCINFAGNYSCECPPCFIWNEAKTDCMLLCQNNPCQNNGYCQVNKVQGNCGFQCTCSEEFKGPTCSEVNDTVRTSKVALAITGGVLGGLLVIVIIIVIIMIYKVIQRSGYFSFRSTK